MDTHKKINSPAQTETGQLTRRDFLKTVLSVAGGVLALELGFMTFVYMLPRQGVGDFGGVINVGSVDDFPPGSVTPIIEGRFFLSRLQDGGLLAVYHKCTHLGCTVPWDPEKQKFVCPCHSAEYDAAGQFLSAPAPRSLDLFEVRVDDNKIVVDTGITITRDNFDISQVVYP